MSKPCARGQVSAMGLRTCFPSAAALIPQILVGLTPYYLDATSDHLSNIPSPHPVTKAGHSSWYVSMSETLLLLVDLFAL